MREELQLRDSAPRVPYQMADQFELGGRQIYGGAGLGDDRCVEIDLEVANDKSVIFDRVRPSQDDTNAGEQLR